MQTHFTPQALADPETAHSEGIIRKCVRCGFCTATCPTYVTLGNELDSPRGRIYLVKEMLETGRPADERTVTHIDRCLSCLACMTTCPSGVNYGHLVDHARAHIERTYTRPLADRLIRQLLAAVLPYPARFRASLHLARVARPLAPLFDRVRPLRPLAAMLRLAPASVPPASFNDRDGVRPAAHVAAAPAPKRVAILRGCAQRVLDPGINEAAVRLLTRLGVAVAMPAGEGCCGALTHHMGRQASALDFARTNVDAWTREIEGEGLDAILVTTSGCGTTVKDYGHMLRLDPAYAARAARVSALARDVTEFLADLDLPLPVNPVDAVVAYHSACSLQHGQRVTREPKVLLAQAGFTVRDVPEGHLCCGSAGTYNLLQPEISAQLRDRKVANIERVRPDVVAAGNLGCMTQIGSATGIPVVHTVELLDWAFGGPKPRRLEGLGLKPLPVREAAE